MRKQHYMPQYVFCCRVEVMTLVPKKIRAGDVTMVTCPQCGQVSRILHGVDGETTHTMVGAAKK